MFESFNKFTEIINEAKAQYMIGDKEASREDVLSYMFSNPKKPLGNTSTGKFPKWVQSNNTPDGDTIKWSTIKKDMKTLEKEYGKGNVVVSGNTNGGDPVVEIYMKSQNESVVNEAKAITDRDIKVGNSFKIGSSTFKVIKIYKDPKFGNVVNTERYTNNKKAGEYTDTLKDFVDFLNEEDAVAESVVTEASKSNLKKGDKFKSTTNGEILFIIEPKGDGYDYRMSSDPRSKNHAPKAWFDMMIKTGKLVNESVVTEAKSIAKIQKEWAKVTAMMKDTVASYKEAEGKDKEDLLDQLKVLTISKKKLEVELDDAVGIKDMDVELAESRIELVSEGVNELNERTITLKRRYTENYPAITAGKTARIRNKMLEAIADGKLTEEEFNTVLSEMSPDSSRWIRRNARFFNVSEDGIALSKYGMKAYRQTKINESELSEARGSWIVYTGDGEKKFYSEHTSEKSAKKMVDMIIKKFDNVNMMPKESWEKEIAEAFVIENFAAFEARVTEVKRSMISGNSGRTVSYLEDRKYELKKEVKGARIGDYTVTLPKGTIIYNLAGGVYASHKSLKGKYDARENEFGYQVRSMPETLADIEKNGKVLESVVNEGQFSWMTHDSNTQIGSEKQNTIRVTMFDDKGNKWEEKKYDGYGEFGGMDYYELLAQMNGIENADRGDGIAIAFDKKKVKGKVLFPALIEDPKRFNFKKHDFTKEAESDPNQSWYQEEEEYDESVITEGAMSDIHMFANDAKDINDFIKMFFKEFGDKVKKSADTIKLAKELYTDMIDESLVNEAVKISVDMPASMKKWIMGEVKSNPDTWSNELTDLTNTIVSLHRELDLDLSKSDKGPEQIDVRNTPVDELTTGCIETINAIWPKMGEWAKEDIYTDYENWFKVTKKDRPHFGEK